MNIMKVLPFMGGGLVRVALGLSNAAVVAAFCGAEGTAAWALASAPIAILVCLVEAIIDGAAPMIATRIGAGDREGATRLERQAVVLGAAFAALIVVLAGVSYRHSSSGLLPALLLGTAIGTVADGVRAALLGRGDGGAAALGSGAAAAIQLLAGLVFIPLCGVAGVGIAFAIANAAETAIQGYQGRDLLLGTARMGLRRLRGVAGLYDPIRVWRDAGLTDPFLVWRDVANQIGVGLAGGGGAAIRNTAYAGLVVSIEATTGAPGLALHIGILKVSNLTFRVFSAVSGLLTRELSTHIGTGGQAGRVAASRDLWHTGAILGVWALLVSTVQFALPDAAWSWVCGEGIPPAALHAAVLALVLGAPLEVTGALAGSALQAMRNPRLLAWMEVAPSLISAAAAVGALQMGYGVAGVWAAFALDAALSTLIGWFCWTRRTW